MTCLDRRVGSGREQRQLNRRAFPAPKGERVVCHEWRKKIRALTGCEFQCFAGGMSMTSKVTIGGALVVSPAYGAMLLVGYYSTNQC